MTYKEARVYLDEMSKYGSVLGLDTIRGLLRELGNPQDDLKFIHIAGTNGKGSVLAYTSTILSKAGYKTGRYVSPTVISYLEKIQVDGEWISETEFADITEQVKEAIDRLKSKEQPVPTVFETETAMAFLYFKKKNCDLVVLETGLGGETDATNIVKNTVCAAFATISVDHLGMIGDSLEEIAQTKSGIIKPGCKVVSARQKESISKILQEKAGSLGCVYVEAEPELMEIEADDYKGITFSYKEYLHMQSQIAGECQRENLAAALEVINSLKDLGYEITEEAVRDGIRETRWAGRFTCLSEEPVVIVDGAHNEDAAKKLRTSLERYFKEKEIKEKFQSSRQITIGSLRLDLSDGHAYLNNADTGLTRTEFALLRLLAENQEKIFSAKELYEAVWGSCAGTDTSTVRRHIFNLRVKIGAEDTDEYDIVSVYGKGYLFTCR